MDKLTAIISGYRGASIFYSHVVLIHRWN